MANSATTLRAWRDRLEAARYSAVREVEDQNGERVVYRSDFDLQRALSAVTRAIAEAEAGQQPTTIRFSTSKGL